MLQFFHVICPILQNLILAKYSSKRRDVWVKVTAIKKVWPEKTSLEFPVITTSNRSISPIFMSYFPVSLIARKTWCG